MSASELTIAGSPALRGSRAGEGSAVVLCHGLTASRGYVVHGSRVLERDGHRVVAYDARGHGLSEPAPPGGSYGYPELVTDLERVVAAEVADRTFVLAGHSMGAHTAVAYALAHPDRLAGLVLIGPTYTGPVEAESLAYWDGLADALATGGVDAFVDFVVTRGEIAEAFRPSVARFTRERMLLHRHPEAVVAALRAVPRSAPFGSLDELAVLEVPSLVVASGDEADPGHPHAVAVAYADALARARLVSEGPGQSPLAWQGGRLSREISGFCNQLAASLS